MKIQKRCFESIVSLLLVGVFILKYRTPLSSSSERKVWLLPPQLTPLADFIKHICVNIKLPARHHVLHETLTQPVPEH